MEKKQQKRAKNGVKLLILSLIFMGVGIMMGYTISNTQRIKSLEDMMIDMNEQIVYIECSLDN